MSRYILIRRLRGPAFLLLIGVVALLHQTGLVFHMWRLFWPLALILWGVLLLAERAALEMEGYPQPFSGAPYPGGPMPPSPNPGPAPGPPTTSTSASIVPADADEFGRGSNGGQS
jgi:hypothetical protein